MSRVDEALRRAASMCEGFEVARPESPAVVDATILERYAPERPIKASEPRQAKPTPLATIGPGSEGPLRSISAPLEQEGKLVISASVPTHVVEQYRCLAAILNDLQSQRGVKTVMVSSAAPREGKTLTITNLALTLSESYQQRVLLIDADLRRPSVHEVLGIVNGPGLSDVVRSGGLEFPSAQLSQYLSVLTAGRTDSTLLAQLTSDAMKRAIAHAAKHFDWVLVDTPPVGLLPDAQLVERLCEATIFVIGAGVAPYDFVQRSITALGPDRIIGAVLNRCDQHPTSRHNYYHHYGRAE
jgi:capsular exopolysaccharide synthesis family protein